MSAVAPIVTGELQTVAEMTTHALRVVDAIHEEHRLAQTAAGDAMEHAIACGGLLIAQKGRVAHGNFMNWIAAHCRFEQAQANAYMALARNPDAARKLKAMRHMYASGRVSRPRKALPAPSPPDPEVAPPRVGEANDDLPLEQAIAALEADGTADCRRRLKEFARARRGMKEARRRFERSEIRARNAEASVLAAARKLREAHE